MEIELISFGKIAELIGTRKVDITDIHDTDSLKVYLETLFPLLTTIKYKIALNQHVVQSNQRIAHHDTVALMPPFSGG